MDIKPIMTFLRAHADSRAFQWTNPKGELGLYRSKLLKVTQIDFTRMSVTVTFVTAYKAEPT